MAASPGEAKEELNETDIHLRGVELSCFTPEGIEVSWSSVAEVDVTLVGEKRMLDRINVRHLTTAYLDVSELKAGDRVVRLIPGKNVSMDLPSGVRIQGVEPKAVTVRLRKLPTPTP